jgi:hypothetical protein
MALAFTAVSVEDTGRLSRIREQMRTDHLNNEECVSLIKLCEECNNTFHLPGYKLTYTTGAELVTPKPSIDPSRAINTKPYRISEIQKEAVKKLNKC